MSTHSRRPGNPPPSVVRRRQAVTRPQPLDEEEYIEQAHLYELLRLRTAEQMPIQELLEQLRHEVLATTKLPMAMEYLLTEVKHSGLLAPAMQRMGHYFTDFQTYLIRQSEEDTGRFLMGTALQIMEAEVKFRIQGATPAGMFLFQFEVLCRNRLSYDKGLTAISNDPIFDDDWSKWILGMRAQIGLVELSDLLFLVSDEYKRRLLEAGESIENKGPFLFGEKEGRIAFANRRKDPLFLFGALQRHLGYPKVPRIIKTDPNVDLVPQLARRLERLEARIGLMEEERRAGLDITKFYEQNKHRLKLPE
ncbi:hypothetical protein [Stieleria varia]|uniref:Uncharacterized protein n=1 Tax=Stieleria varia TaxID=2528005 RepID=A0A5C5ZPT8_9BACT|nr:hypothetical protein [Stieleria varia]TWT89489.1 hypothetical protein Pla52n_67770 [Stieleria varia]